MWDKIRDPGVMAECIPGCDSIEQMSQTSYRAVVAVKVGPISARFSLVVDVVGEEPPTRLVARARGEEGGRASVLSPKRGCNQGVCGSCTVLIDGEPRRACFTLVERSEGADVRTVEGLADDKIMQALQRAFVVSGGVQCGFCTPGVVASARALLAQTPSPDEREVKAALSGNLCRCTGYRTIVEAVLAAAKEVAL